LDLTDEQLDPKNISLNTEHALDPRWEMEGQHFRFRYKYPYTQLLGRTAVGEGSFGHLLIPVPDVLQVLQTCNREFELNTDFDKSVPLSSNMKFRDMRKISLDNLGRGDLHIIHDFDEIQELYCQAVEAAEEARLQATIQKTEQDLMNERKLLEELVMFYLYAPLKRDEQYRNINKEVFQDFDDDPIWLHDTGVKRKLRNVSGYAKLKVLSKQAVDQREIRRDLLLNSPKETEEDDQRWVQEVDRISGALGYIFNKKQYSK